MGTATPVPWAQQLERPVVRGAISASCIQNVRIWQTVSNRFIHLTRFGQRLPKSRSKRVKLFPRCRPLSLRNAKPNPTRSLSRFNDDAFRTPIRIKPAHVVHDVLLRQAIVQEAGQLLDISVGFANPANRLAFH